MIGLPMILFWLKQKLYYMKLKKTVFALKGMLEKKFAL